MRMKSETIAEASEPSSLGSFASGSNDHCESGHNLIARVSDVALEGVDDECADIEEGQVGQISETKSVRDAKKNYQQGKALTNGFGSSDEEEKEPAVPDDRPPSRDRRRMRQISTSLIR